MTKSDLHDDIMFRDIDEEWIFHDSNVIYRIFKLKEKVSELHERMDLLETFIEEYESDEEEPSPKLIREARRSILRLMNCVEVIAWNFPHLASETWFGHFKEDIAHGYWRTEEGRYRDAETDQDELGQLYSEARRIFDNTSNSQSQGVLSRLSEYFEFMDIDFQMKKVPEEYDDAIREAADLYCLGYYSTALLVLGRAVEKCLLQLGEDRRVESVRMYGDEVDWEDTKFHFRNVALNRINMPKMHGKVLSDRQYHQIAILVDYRNNVAHSDYEQIDRDAALRQCMESVDLLEELNDAREHLQELDDEDIDPIYNQKVQ
ncbi:hypothetical protein [Natrinema versiforme]|uniref:hypothetical protein n=1 Tax=Natrinema versiforme TaxID=88724 RepID=UPI001269256D|nr:hypothetical protein [Natrinema versiforme]